MKRFLAMLAIPMAANAAPFLVSDPYPAAGPQPASFTCAFDGKAGTVLAPAKDANGLNIMKFDLSSLSFGPHTSVCFATDGAGVNTASVSTPFDTSAFAPLAAPANIHVVPN